MRPNPGLNIEAAITELAVGEALVSLLDAKGRPSPSERAWIIPPRSRIGPASVAERQAIQQAAGLASKYVARIDSASAYEALAARAGASRGSVASAGSGQREAADAAPETSTSGGLMGSMKEVLFGSTGPRGGKRDGLVQSVVKSVARSQGRALLRGLLGALLGSKRR
jgi:hypothetical protein